MPFRLPMCLVTGIVMVTPMAAWCQTPTGPIEPLQKPPGLSANPMTGDLRNPNELRHRDSLGRPCLDIKAESRPQPSNPNIFQHIVGVNNKCLQRIRIKLCYAKAEQCYMTEIPGNQRRETILGIYPSIKYFRFEYQEQY